MLRLNAVEEECVACMRSRVGGCDPIRISQDLAGSRPALPKLCPPCMAINVAVLIALLFVPAARAGAATATSATGAAHVANDSDAGSVAADLLDAPTQFHIAAAGRTSVRVGWMTMNESASVCVYGPATGAEPTLQADGTAREYLRGAGWHHVVLLTNLTAGGRYVYTCGDGAGAMGDAVYFTAPPSATTDVSLAIWGDLGYLNSTVRPGIIPVEGLELNWTSTFTWELLNRLTSDGAVDAAWWLGDIGYSDDASFWEQYVFSFEVRPVRGLPARVRVSPGVRCPCADTIRGARGVSCVSEVGHVREREPGSPTVKSHLPATTREPPARASSTKT